MAGSLRACFFLAIQKSHNENGDPINSEVPRIEYPAEEKLAGEGEAEGVERRLVVEAG